MGLTKKRNRLVNLSEPHVASAREAVARRAIRQTPRDRVPAIDSALKSPVANCAAPRTYHASEFSSRGSLPGSAR